MKKREMEDQILDSMELERERGITIKARAVRLDYRADDGEKYVLNLIDTPGHVDFNYEVSRSLSACEGAVLVVDASQGIEAQTLANTYLAVDNGLEVLPVVNKIDLPAARPAEVKKEIEDVIGIPAMDAPEISAKNGINIHSVLEMIVKNVPAPTGDREAPLQCLIFDSQYDSYRGAIVYLRVVNGTVYPGMDIRMMASGAVYKVVEVGYLHPKGMIPAESLGAGEVGYLTASIKTVSDTRVGDTITGVENPAAEALPGYHQAQPMVFSGVYPADGSKYGDLRDALEKLKLNDASMSFTQENSIALGFGFRCGFLGLLHMEIILERLEREYNLDLITTAPNVVYKITKTDGTQLDVYTPLNYPDPAEIAEAQEPYAKANLIAPPEYVGAIMDLCQNRRGEFKDMQYLDPTRVELHYSMPLNEIIYDFFDALKSRTRGYGSLDYELEGYRPSKLVKLDILLNGEIVDALSFILFADNAYARARKICEKLKDNIPRQMFEIPVQAAVGGKIIARETIKALRKDVLAKCYGGDITRKRNCSKSRRRARSVCARSARSPCRPRRSWPSSSSTTNRRRGFSVALIQIVENKKKSLGIYVHIPFCRSKCEYCDFYSVPGARSRDLMDRYLDAVILHIREAAQGAAGYEVDTVYFGGGTPSFFGAGGLAKIFAEIDRRFDVSRDAEVSLEANPDSVTLPMLTRLRRAGFNRISIGVQSDDDAQLKALGRPHTYRQAQQAVSLSRRAGFDNVSVDLMFGLPSQSRESGCRRFATSSTSRPTTSAATG